MQMVRKRFNGDLMSVLRDGPAVLPDDLGSLHGHLRLIASLLAEKATEERPEWVLELEAAAEIETLQMLETIIAEKAAQVPSRTLHCVLGKLDIWATLECGDTENADALRDRLIQSVRADLERMAHRRDGGPARGSLY